MDLMSMSQNDRLLQQMEVQEQAWKALYDLCENLSGAFAEACRLMHVEREKRPDSEVLDLIYPLVFPAIRAGQVKAIGDALKWMYTDPSIALMPLLVSAAGVAAHENQRNLLMSLWDEEDLDPWRP